MAGYNRVILCGRLGKDPEEKVFANGGKIVNFSVATSETWKDKASGERKEKTEWHNVTIQNENICGIAMQYLSKGSEVLVEGSLQTRKWQDSSGADRYSTEVVVGRFNGSMTLVGGRGGGAAPKPDAGGFPADLDDDVPF